MNIKILGGQGEKLNELQENTKQAMKRLGIKANIKQITDIQTILEHGVIMTPALIINDRIRTSGKVPNTEKIIEILKVVIKNK